MLNMFKDLISFIRNLIFSSDIGSRPWFIKGTIGIQQEVYPDTAATQEKNVTTAAAETQQEVLLDRIKRLLISGPIHIATALGVSAIAIAAGTAHVIASNQATKVLKTEQAHRIEDINNSVFNKW